MRLGKLILVAPRCSYAFTNTVTYAKLWGHAEGVDRRCLAGSNRTSAGPWVLRERKVDQRIEKPGPAR